MRYYCTIKRGQVTVESEYTIPAEDKRVENFFKPTPAGYVKAYTTEGLPFNEIVPVYVDPEKTIQQQIIDLENTITKRNYREAFINGDQYSIDKINKVEADIALLRKTL